MTVSVAEPPKPSHTANWNLKMPVLLVISEVSKLGDCEVGSSSVIIGPSICDHLYVSESPSGSVPEPLKVTWSPLVTV